MIVPTSNPQVIKEILDIDNIYKSLVYDDSPSLEDFKVEDKLWFILFEQGNVAGLISLEPLNNILWIPHIYIYEIYRGSGSEKWGKAVIAYMKEMNNDVKFLAFTPYLSAKKYAERIGFKYIMTLPKSVKKNGELLHQYMLEWHEEILQ